MKGLQALFIGIFGIFAFSWLGTDRDSKFADRQSQPADRRGWRRCLSSAAFRNGDARRASLCANGCVYCHSQQVRPDYGGSDLERKWGDRRSAPRDYIFEPIVLLGKMRVGPDLANVGHRPALQEKGAAVPTSPTAGTAASPAASPSLGASPAAAVAAASASPAPAVLPAAGDKPAPNVATAAPALVGDVAALTSDGKPIPYSAAWHHRHLYAPRSVNEDSIMPAYRFLYQKRRISGVASADSINFVGATHDNPESGWEIVPSYEAKCLVAYLMSRDQSHALKEAKSPVIAAAPGKEAQK